MNHLLTGDSFLPLPLAIAAAPSGRRRRRPRVRRPTTTVAPSTQSAPIHIPNSAGSHRSRGALSATAPTTTENANSADAEAPRYAPGASMGAKAAHTRSGHRMRPCSRG